MSPFLYALAAFPLCLVIFLVWIALEKADWEGNESVRREAASEPPARV